MNAATHWISVPVEDGAMDAYLALPPRGHGPGLLLFQEIFGVNAHIRAVAEQYALDGYVVLAPDVFWRQARRADLGYDGDDLTRARAMRAATPLAAVQADLDHTLRTFKTLPEVRGDLATVGYCYGGMLAFLAAASGQVAAASSYYGPGVLDHLQRVADIRCPIQLHLAEHDSMLPLAGIDRIRAAFAAHPAAQIHVYPGAHHGFNCWDRAAYHQPSAALAHGRTLSLLAQISSGNA